MDKHTPTPWRVEKNTTLIWGACNADDTTSWGMGYPIAECRSAPTSSWAKGPVDTEEAEATAHFICHAVNSHASLLPTIKELMEALEPISKFEPPSPWSDDVEVRPTVTVGNLRKASAALSRAKSLMEQKP